jgi:hypothetical protein
MATKPLPTALPQIKIHPVSGEAIGCDCYRGLDDLMNRNRRSIFMRIGIHGECA